MKKILLIMIKISSCTKQESSCTNQEPQRTSNEVLVSISNTCRARIKFYSITDGRQYLSDIFDCSYVSFLALSVEQGKYKVKAETASGRSAEKLFTKGKFSQELNIEF